jgi:acetylornithine deacetylase/succinyl-diaminopimelate desuccinylase-like protein
VLLATADEEDGSYKGMRWIAENRPDWLEAEYGLSEGAGGEMEIRGRRFFTCQVAEKGACRFKLRAHSTPGHASRPHRDNALTKLGAALERLGDIPLPLKPTNIVREMLLQILGDTPETRTMVEDLSSELTFDLALEDAPFDPSMKLALNAQMHNTATPTVLHWAGNRINVIPPIAEASVDGRLMPDETVEVFIQEVREVVGDGVEIEVYDTWEGGASPFKTELFQILRDVTHEVTGAGLVPFLATGASDARFAQQLGVITYGFGPMRNEPDASPPDLMHAPDERISLANLELGLRVLHEAVARVAGSR